MASRGTSHGQFTFTSMLSLDPATVGKDGYREIFQVGEALNGRPLIDRQHPHDFFMQLAAIWRAACQQLHGIHDRRWPGGRAGPRPGGIHAPGVRRRQSDGAAQSSHVRLDAHVLWRRDRGRRSRPVACRRRRSSTAASRTRTGGISISAGSTPCRAGSGFEPNAEWELQASTGHLVDPEATRAGQHRALDGLRVVDANETRPTISSVTVGYGRNDTDHGAGSAVFVEGARHVGLNTIYGRFEGLQVETALLQTDLVLEGPAADVKDPVFAFTVGGVRDVLQVAGFEGGIGADVTFYGVPDVAAAGIRQSPGVVSRVLPPSAASRLDGTDVEHAHVAADGRPSDVGEIQQT